MNFRKRVMGAQVGFQMAPLIDIMFLTLILFMSAMIYAQWETKIGIMVPTAISGVRSVRRVGEIVINLDAAGRIHVNDIELSPERLEGLLAKVAKDFRDQSVIIRADAETPHKHVVAVLDMCRKVDIWNVAFATLPRKGG
jgi:biopolymer transport protein ExbD